MVANGAPSPVRLLTRPLPPLLSSPSIRALALRSGRRPRFLCGHLVLYCNRSWSRIVSPLDSLPAVDSRRWLLCGRFLQQIYVYSHCCCRKLVLFGHNRWLLSVAVLGFVTSLRLHISCKFHLFGLLLHCRKRMCFSQLDHEDRNTDVQIRFLVESLPQYTGKLFREKKSERVGNICAVNSTAVALYRCPRNCHFEPGDATYKQHLVYDTATDWLGCQLRVDDTGHGLVSV